MQTVTLEVTGEVPVRLTDATVLGEGENKNGKARVTIFRTKAGAYVAWTRLPRESWVEVYDTAAELREGLMRDDGGIDPAEKDALTKASTRDSRIEAVAFEIVE